jgi:hypothetical protein
MQLDLARAAPAAAMIAAAMIAPAAPACATGSGSYLVQGAGPGGASPYQGTAEVKETGQGTWRMHWQIGSQGWDGSGVGDAQAFAITFFSGNQAGTVLYVSDGKGGYRGIWAGLGATRVGIESLTPAPPKSNPQ